MASDTTKKKKTASASTSKTTKKASTVSTSKKGTGTKKTTTKKATTTAPKKKTNTKTNGTKKKTTNSTKKNQNVKVKSTPKVKPIEIEDLETREADLTKTVVINPEIIQELHNEEIEVPNIDNIKIEEEPKKTKKGPEKVARTILGIDLPSQMTSEDRKERKKFYVKDALIFAIIIPILDLFAMLFIDSYTYLMITNSAPLNYLITLLLDFTLIFLITYLIDYIFGEDAVKRINR